MPFHVMNFHFAEYYLVDFIVCERTNGASTNTNPPLLFKCSSILNTTTLNECNFISVTLRAHRDRKSVSHSDRQTARQTNSNSSSTKREEMITLSLHIFTTPMLHTYSLSLNGLLFDRVHWHHSFAYNLLTEQRKERWNGVQTIICQQVMKYWTISFSLSHTSTQIKPLRTQS